MQNTRNVDPPTAHAKPKRRGHDKTFDTGTPILAC